MLAATCFLQCPQCWAQSEVRDLLAAQSKLEACARRRLRNPAKLGVAWVAPPGWHVPAERDGPHEQDSVPLESHAGGT